MIDFSDHKNAEAVFGYFLEISRIPHGSGNTAPIADYLVEFAKAHGLQYYRDAADNVVIKKAATAGFEERPTVIIQGHTDMVAEKLPSLSKDMLNEGLEVFRDGDFLRARGTTLGGDDGVAVAYCLALLDSDTTQHPALECLFTSDEEIGLLGAGALDASVLSGKIMINIDSDDEGIFTVGCAGGARNDITLPVNTAGGCGKQYKLTVSGLLGGHSGAEIDRGRANAIKLLAKVLGSISDVRIADICGGNADNAIPRECTAYFTSDSDVASVVRAADAEYKKEYRDTDGGVTLTLEAVSFDKPLLDKASSDTALAIINETESGVIAMSREIVGLPESSENIGIVRLEGGVFHMTVSVRSAKADAKADLIENLRAIAKRNGAAISTRGEYPAWEYKAESHIREIACRVFYEMYGKEAKVITIHAGLECGIFSDKIEGLDCISLGPDNYDIHTTEEHLSISSTARVWDYLINVLKEI